MEDAYEKTKLILTRCKQRNVVLKFAKTWSGFDSCEFFGYRCMHGKYELTEKRKESIMAIPMPTSIKKMQRFLGCSVFFHRFIANYADLTAALHDMTKKDFNWDKSTWMDKRLRSHL